MLRCTFNFHNIVKSLYVYIGKPALVKVGIIQDNGNIKSKWFISGFSDIQWLQNVKSSMILPKDNDYIVVKEYHEFDDIPKEVYDIIIKFVVEEIFACIPYEQRQPIDFMEFLKTIFTHIDIDELLFEYFQIMGYVVSIIRSEESTPIQIYHVNTGPRGLVKRNFKSMHEIHLFCNKTDRWNIMTRVAVAISTCLQLEWKYRMK